MNLHYKLYPHSLGDTSRATVFAWATILDLNIPIPTGIHIDKQQWDDQNKILTGRTRNVADWNQRMDQLKHQVEERYKQEVILSKDKFLKPYEIHRIVVDEMRKILIYPKPRHTLTKTELSKLARHKFNNVQINRLASQYVLSCFTGVSLSKIPDLTSCDIRQWFDKLYIKDYEGLKEITIPLLKIARNWLDHIEDDKVGQRCPKYYNRLLLQDIPKALESIAIRIRVKKVLNEECIYNTYLSSVLTHETY